MSLNLIDERKSKRRLDVIDNSFNLKFILILFESITASK